jgi:tetratricopeptide (TPR) repeat protein
MTLGCNRIAARFRALAILAVWVGVSAAAQPQNESDFQSLLQRGFQLHQQARFSESIPVLQQARKLEPGDYFANLLLGIDLLRIGKATEAVPKLQLAAHARPAEEFPEEYLGEAEATLGEQALAAEAYQRAVLRGHSSAQALEAWAGFALERFRQIGESLRASQEGLEVARRLQKSAASESGSTAESGCTASIPLLERKLALKKVHLDGESAYRLSVCYAVEAGKAAERLKTGGDDVAAVHRLRGDVLLRLKGDAAGAEAEYEQAIAMRQQDPELLERLAEAQLSAGDTEGGQRSAQEALALNPHQRGALRTLATLAMSNRDYAQALPWLRQLADEAPGDRTVGVELGRALAQTGDPAAALQLLAPTLSAGYPDEKGALHALMAQVLRKLGRDAEAAKAETDARRLSDAFQARSARGAPSVTDQDHPKSADHESPDADRFHE